VCLGIKNNFDNNAIELFKEYYNDTLIDMKLTRLVIVNDKRKLAIKLKIKNENGSTCIFR
jgi:hypothetical protein